MRFEISTSTNKDSFILKDTQTQTQAEIYTFGAILNQFSIKTDAQLINVIDGYKTTKDAKENITDGFRSAKLSPFVCRLNKGEFNFDGAHYKINKHYMGDSAIHGLLYDAEFLVASTHVDDLKASLSLHYKYDSKENGFPFSFTIEVLYKLDTKNQLKVTTSVINTGASAMPLNDGWHPYFKLGKTIDTAFVKFNSKELVEFDESLLPNGKTSAYTTFNEFKIFGDLLLDNCFTLNSHEVAAFQMKDEQTGVQLNITPDVSYPYLQIYTPPSRQSIAVENLSSVPDSFNNKTGLIILKKGETRHFSTTYQLALL